MKSTNQSQFQNLLPGFTQIHGSLSPLHATLGGRNRGVGLLSLTSAGLLRLATGRGIYGESGLSSTIELLKPSLSCWVFRFLGPRVMIYLVPAW